MQLLHKVAGFSLSEADIIRRYMSKKKVEEFIKYEPKFVQGMKAAGAKEVEAKQYWDELVDFSHYAFNKSHAAAYAFLAYITSYLKYYYPAEYIAAVLNMKKVEEFPLLIQEAKKRKISVCPPDINDSEEGFSVKNGEILFGLCSVKGWTDDIIEIFGKIYVHVNEPLSSALYGCYSEAKFTGDTSQAFKNLEKKIEHPKFKEVIRNIAIASRHEADYATVIEDLRSVIKSYMKDKSERKVAINEGRVEILVVLAAGGLLLWMLANSLGVNLIPLLFGNLIGWGILGFLLLVIAFALKTLIKFDK